MIFIRRIAVASVACALVAGAAGAQKFELTPFGGYVFEGELTEDYLNQVTVDSSTSYGLFMDFGITRHHLIELIWSHQETEIAFDPVFEPGLFAVDADIDYFHVGYAYQWTPGHIEPYVGGSIGVSRFELAEVASEERFSVALAGGVKIMGPHLGFRFEHRIWSTYIEENDEVFCNPRYCVVYRNVSLLLQFDLKAGLVIRF